MKISLIGVLSLATLAGCATGTRITVTSEAAAAGAPTPKAPGDIKIFAEEPPAGSFKTVAVIEASQAPLMADSRQGVLHKMLARAGELGCDGVVLEPEDSTFGTSGTKLTYGWLSTIPTEGIVAETWMGFLVEPKGDAASYPEHWTLEGFRAECLMAL